MKKIKFRFKPEGREIEEEFSKKIEIKTNNFDLIVDEFLKFGWFIKIKINDKKHYYNFYLMPLDNYLTIKRFYYVSDIEKWNEKDLVKAIIDFINKLRREKIPYLYTLPFRGFEKLGYEKYKI